MEVELMVARLHMLSFNQAHPTFSPPFVHSWVWGLARVQTPPRNCYNIIKQKIASPHLNNLGKCYNSTKQRSIT
jgi:hypothetical protein